MSTFGELVRLVCVASPTGGLSGPERPMTDDLVDAEWRKSSWSSFNGNCVEVAELHDGRIGVRDTKDNGLGPVLHFEGADWRAFIDGVKNGGLPH